MREGLSSNIQNCNISNAVTMETNVWVKMNARVKRVEMGVGK